MTGIVTSIILSALMVIAVLAMNILLCVWVYRDAQHKGMNGVLWTAVAFLVPSYIGFIIYLIVRSDHNHVTCSNCNKYVNGLDKFCSNCGSELVPLVIDDREFKQSQKKVLIGFFASLAATLVFGIFSIATMVIGSVEFARDVMQWFSNVNWVSDSGWIVDSELEDTIEDALGDLDVLFDEEEIKLSVTEDEVVITDKEGNELFKVDGDKETVDMNISELKRLFEEYGVQIDENLSEEELEQQVKKRIEEEMQDTIEDVFEMDSTEEM